MVSSGLSGSTTQNQGDHKNTWHKSTARVLELREGNIKRKYEGRSWKDEGQGWKDEGNIEH